MEQTEKDSLKLARSTCANHNGDDGTCYVLDEPCQPMRCVYFQNAVLETDEALKRRYWSQFGAVYGNVKTCTACSGTFERKSNRQKYCPDCAADRKRTRSREGMAKNRRNS
jgi:hypothetical protein